MARPLSLVVDVWDPARGGLEAYADRLLRGLVARGFAAEVVCGRAVGRPPADLRCLGGRGPAFHRAVDREHAAGRLPLPLSFRHPGAVGGVFLPLGGLFVDALDARRAAEPGWRRPLGRVARGLSPRTRAFVARERAWFASAGSRGLVLAASERTAAAVRVRFPGFAGRVEVTGLPVDAARFRPPSADERARARRALGVPDGDAVLLWLGNDARRKGRARACAASAVLRRTGVAHTLVLAGRAAGSSAVRGHLALGPRADVPELLHAADVLLHPTFEDNLALAVLEALAAGVPVVTTDADGAAEWAARAPGCEVVDVAAGAEVLAAACRRASTSPRSSAGDRRAAVTPCFADAHLDRVAALLAPLVEEAPV